jgi:hypothetical protein
MKGLIIIILITAGSLSLFAQSREYLDALDKKYTSSLFSGDNAYRLAPMTDPAAANAVNVIQYMQGRVPGLIISYGRGFTPILTFRTGYPTIFLDEVRVDAQTLSIINMDDIAYIKVFRQSFIGSFGNIPAIAVYTRDGDE